MRTLPEAANIFFVTTEQRIEQLEKSHDQLRGALVAAGFHIRKLRQNPANAKMLHLLRSALREARTVRKTELAKRRTA